MNCCPKKSCVFHPIEVVSSAPSIFLCILTFTVWAFPISFCYVITSLISGLPLLRFRIFGVAWQVFHWLLLNPLTPNDPYSGRTAPLTSKRCILYIYSTNIDTEYFKHGIYSPFLSLQNAVCFIIVTYLVPVLFTFYIQVS